MVDEVDDLHCVGSYSNSPTVSVCVSLRETVMCGIAGFIDRDGSFRDPHRILRRMSDAIRLRGPDDEGTWFDESSRVGFGFRRLSIQDCSADGHQPMSSRSGRFTIAFNGEVYNFKELRTELHQKGHQFKGGSDTEVMLAAFEEWGVRESIPRFVGMFAFSVWDAKLRKLFLARDRVGVKPLFWGRMGPGSRTIVFGSELKAIRALPLRCPPVDRGAVALFMRFSYVPSPHCIFEGFQKLQPGHVVEIDPATGRDELWEYWSAARAAEAAVKDQILDYKEALERVDQQLTESVRLRMIADVPLGSFLSGGVDSSLVTAIAARLSSQPLRTYTIGFREAVYDEAPHARKIAEHLGTNHTEFYVGAAETLDVIPKLVDIYDEPFADSSAIPSYIVCKLARRDITVALCGDGGDELFGGYDRYPFAQRLEGILHRWPYSMRLAMSVGTRAVSLLPAAVLRPLNLHIPGHTESFPRDRLLKLATMLGLRHPSEVYARLASVVKNPELYLVDPRAPLCPMTDPAWTARVSSAILRGSTSDMACYMPDEILAKMDRTSMANSLEAREPLTDHRLIELALRLPDHFKFAGGRNKVILRDLLDRYVPRELVDRPKMGFSVPIGDWLRGELKDWGAALLDRKRLESEGFLDAESVHELWEEHQAGHARSQWELWNCLMFETWLERWGTSDPQSAADAEVPLLITVDEAGRDLEAVLERRQSDVPSLPPAHNVDGRSDSTDSNTRKQFAGGAFWGLVQAGVQKTSGLLTYLIAAWTLTPGDVGAVTTAISVATLLSFVFPGAAGDLLVRHQRNRNLWETACLWLALFAGLSILVLCIFVYPILHTKYADPNVSILVIAMAIRVVLEGVTSVASAKLRLNYRFKYLATVDTVSAVSMVAGTGALGILGFGGWALMAPMLLSSMIRCLFTMTAAGLSFTRPGLPTRMRTLAGDFWAGSVQHYLNGATQTIDYFAISVFHPDDVLGRYTIAYQIASAINVMLSYTVAGIAQPILAQLQHDPARMRQTYLATIRLTLAVTAPICISLAIASPVLIHVLLPERWSLAWISLSILCAAFLALGPVQVAAAYMRACGRFKSLLRFQIAHTALLTIAVFLAAWLGIARHVAFSVFCVAALAGPIAVALSVHFEKGTTRVVLVAYGAPIVAGSIAMLPQLLMLYLFGDTTLISLAAQVGAGLFGMALYVGVLRLVAPGIHKHVRELMQEMSKRAAKPFAE